MRRTEIAGITQIIFAFVLLIVTNILLVGSDVDIYRNIGMWVFLTNFITGSALLIVSDDETTTERLNKHSERLQQIEDILIKFIKEIEENRIQGE